MEGGFGQIGWENGDTSTDRVFYNVAILNGEIQVLSTECSIAESYKKKSLSLSIKYNKSL